MLALITGAGALPDYLRRRLREDGVPFVHCALQDGDQADFRVRLGQLGGLVQALKGRGVTAICLAGGVDRRTLAIGQVDAATAPLVPRLREAMKLGDDGALKLVIEIFREAGLDVVGAHELRPELLPGPGFLGPHRPSKADIADCERAAEVLHLVGPADIGQGCVVSGGKVLAIEALPGTDDMLKAVASYRSGGEQGGVLMKAPKRGQDRRADLPTIGPQTVTLAGRAGLSGIIVEAGGVIVLDPDDIVRKAEAAGMFVWVRAP